jgi:hypothetical protein
MARNSKPSKKSGRHRAGGTKRKHREETGIDNAMAHFFLGGENKIAGLMHYKPPRWTDEYEKMRVTDLVRRIQDDLGELQARAYPTGADRSFPISYERRLRRVIHRNISESLRPGLHDRILSREKNVREPALNEYNELVQRLLAEEPRHAANALVFLTQWAATYLENLFFNQRELVKEIARTRDLWPVNLGRRVKIIKDEPTHEVTRLAFAHNYLTDIELNSQCNSPSPHESGAEPVSPFKLAAEQLYSQMLLLKHDPHHHVWFPKVTPWAKQLFALKMPMTKSNSADWWKVAKVYLDERWDKEQQEFKPLIKHLGLKLSIKVPYQSMIKRRVIDNDLNDAFIALARPDL